MTKKNYKNINLRKDFFIFACVLTIFAFTSCQVVSGVSQVGGLLANVSGDLGLIDKDLAKSISTSATAVSDSAESIGSASEAITPEQEYYLGRAVAGTLLTTYSVYENEEIQEYLNYVCHAITSNSSKPNLYKNYYVQLLDSDELNAFASSGGHILITKGILQNVTSEDEIAAVIAHEIAHIHLQHSVKSIKSSRVTSAIMTTTGSALVVASGGSSETEELVASFDEGVNEIISNMVEKGYSQDNEYDADKYALKLLSDAGYDLNSMQTMLTMLEEKSTAKSGFGKTHPTAKRRMKKLKKEYAKYPVCVTQNSRQERFEEAWKTL